MYLTKEKKEEIFAQYGKSVKDTGSTEGQIALFTYRIQNLTELMKQHKKDQVSERALVGLVGKRRKMLDYLKEKDIERYRAIVKQLGLRK
ncbi:MAG: 30S ribosomal protein S15 [Bacteroidales bacterium]|jgi:small subunit ribosomal protein S15|nr:30S ribosomal protein S15 [Bacteroidales bacterium]